LDAQDEGAVAPEVSHVVDGKGRVAAEKGEASQKKSEVSEEKGAVAQETSHVAIEKRDIAQAKSEGNQEMSEASGEEGAPHEDKGEGAQETSGSEVVLENGEVAEEMGARSVLEAAATGSALLDAPPPADSAAVATE